MTPLALTSPTWHDHLALPACHGTAPLMDGLTMLDVLRAQALCEHCPVDSRTCRAAGEAALGHGVWGGVLLEKGRPTKRESLTES